VGTILLTQIYENPRVYPCYSLPVIGIASRCAWSCRIPLQQSPYTSLIALLTPLIFPLTPLLLLIVPTSSLLSPLHWCGSFLNLWSLARFGFMLMRHPHSTCPRLWFLPLWGSSYQPALAAQWSWWYTSPSQGPIIWQASFTSIASSYQLSIAWFSRIQIQKNILRS